MIEFLIIRDTSVYGCADVYLLSRQRKDIMSTSAEGIDEAELATIPVSEEVKFAPQSSDALEATSAGLLSACQVSRAVDDVSEIKTFYKAIFGVDPVFEQTTKDGVKTVAFQLNSQATVQIKFVERPGQTGKHTTSWFQDLLVGANEKCELQLLTPITHGFRSLPPFLSLLFLALICPQPST